MNLKSTEPVSFLYTADRDGALRFYCDKLGLTLRSSDPFGDFIAMDNAVIRLTPMPDFRAGQHPVFGWNVSDIRATVHALRDKGVAFTVYDGMGQDEDGIWTAPGGMAKVAWFNDPDGNVLSLSQA
ncbi:glyoxalase/bleomycin resistance/dioxygenase family protein [Sphingomonas koreensis]|uniref:VOC family protein n=1 Tax=Sphingomonas koreensis TaxID=93064 RepID=UPI0008339C81|nr:VOC family protein [Sphingomonas koreensis]PJI87683.1 glyoxalase/bleomycin resistance protein/dioxygenase superfamily protein [Sphingomonas koreensis]RSU58293.1 glyoxalase/bleomycin resistance/dioxygenase family protein [Sphingomonas koreensis]RSU71753.1 glyoxalase/bleomycin resistance/dioxygenase family protein [Sphingomonas koreensis]